MADPQRKARGQGHRAANLYERDAATRVWSRPGFGGISYSDGDEAERELLKVLQAASDLSTTSEELAAAVDGWMREAHLSAARSNLLRPFALRPGARVLELGAGCGALTRYLGERGLEVDAVEGNRVRAACAAERCRDLERVRVFAEEITAFTSERKYDVVTLIGVLEYSRLFVDADDPVQASLQRARAQLADGGVLLVAIENQLGLKYFNGCAEDHLGTAYSGITGLYSDQSPVTFGKAELEARLLGAGFANVDWAYPFPDYKLPTTVISSRGLADRDFTAGDMLLGEFGRDYGGSSARSFDESAVWSTLERNGLLGDFANSFLAMASLGPRNPLDDGAWLAYRFSPQRLRRYAASTRIARHGEGIVVTKKVVDSEASAPAPALDGALRVEHRLGDQPYAQGRLLARDFIDAVGRGYAPRDLAAFLKPWIDFLAARSSSSGGDLSALRVPGEYLDCIPTNLVVAADGALVPIDLEFAVPGEIPLPWVALRGTIHLAAKCFGHRELERRTFQGFLDEMLPALGFGAVVDWSPYFELEDSLVRAVLRPWKGRPDNGILRARVALPITSVHSSLDVLERNVAVVAHLTAWLQALPDPGADAAFPDSKSLEVADHLAVSLGTAGAGSFHELLRQLATQRGRWAGLARDNAAISAQLNDAEAKIDQLREEAEAKRLALEQAEQRERDLRSEAGRRERDLRAEGDWRERNARAEAELKERELRAEAARREQELRTEGTHRELELRAELARLTQLSQQETSDAKTLRAELEALRLALAREEGRSSTLREERQALQSELRTFRPQLDNAISHLKRRGGEIARLHRRLRDLQPRELPERRDAPPPGARPSRWWRSHAAPSLPQPVEDPGLAARLATLSASGLFDASWYRREYGHLLAADQEPGRHYLLEGWKRACNPNSLFHEGWYRERNAATLGADEAGLEHYLRVGAKSGAWPNPLFDADWYLHLNPDVRNHAAGPLHHYLVLGAHEGRDPHPLFDTDWFLAEYSDAAALADRVNPLAYFLDNAVTLGHSPCELFDADWYLSQYPDVDSVGVNPLLHYLQHGAAEGRNPSPRFDTRWYLETYPDVARSGANPLVHYRMAGESEGRLPMPRRAPGAGGIVEAAQPAAEVVVDGVQEWQDYAPLKQRIAIEAAHALAEVRVVAPPLITVDEAGIEASIARLAFERHEAPVASIVIPAFNKLSLTLECLESISNSRGTTPFEVIVADDGSTDGTAERLAAVPGLVVHRNEGNLGFLRNCNATFPLARGEYVVLLNNDVQVTSGWLEAMLETFGTYPGVGAVGPRILYPSGHLQEAGVAVRSDGLAEMVGLNDDPGKPRYNYARPVDYVSGACLVLRTELLRELGGFSEEFLPCYCEDSDLCMRIRQRGLRIVYQPAATVVHHLSKTTADGTPEFKLRSVASSLERFARKWQGEIDRLSAVRLLAFYLPQYHPIPENDHWWGAGFTEWSNVARAKPNFVGHYQPRIPADLGFYDLRVPEVMEDQAELARRYGVHGFCFYYYWFAGKRLLEKPVERMLASGKPDLPYCLCWANENWTRRWDGEDHEILVAQDYSPEDDEAVILDLIRHFRDPRYIRIDGKPLLLVYRVTMFPDFRATAERWRRVCRREGVGDIYLALVESFDLVHANVNPADFNCEASVEFPPLGMAQTRPPQGAIINPDFLGNTADYRDIAARFCARALPGFTRFRGVMPGWDNTARRQNNSFCFENATPGAFQAWLETAIAQTRAQHQGDERLVFVNAWNEWAEAAYLEPDKRYGHAFLEAVRNAHDAQGLLRMDRYALDL